MSMVSREQSVPCILKNDIALLLLVKCLSYQLWVSNVPLYTGLQLLWLLSKISHLISLKSYSISLALALREYDLQHPKVVSPR